VKSSWRVYVLSLRVFSNEYAVGYNGNFHIPIAGCVAGGQRLRNFLKGVDRRKFFRDRFGRFSFTQCRQPTPLTLDRDQRQRRNPGRPAVAADLKTSGRSSHLLTVTVEGACLVLVVLWLRWIALRFGLSVRDSALGCGVVAILAVLGTHAFLSVGRRVEANTASEALRLLSILGAAAWVVWPFLTTTFAGGVDARWYAYVLADHLEQSRAGVFPVLVGQGSYQFNGAVHPFRFAPLYQNLGGLLDSATAHQLGVPALQHLILLFCMTVSGVSTYFALTQWHPQRRWTAWVFSLLYMLSPAAVALISVHDMYMSFVAAAWIPLAFHFARRAVDDFRAENAGLRNQDSGAVASSRRGPFSGILNGLPGGEQCLAIAKMSGALTLVLNAHPPVGIWSSLTAFFILAVGTWCFQGVLRAVSATAFGALTLYALNAFHFQGIAEISPVAPVIFSWRDVAAPALAVGLGAALFPWLSRKLRGSDNQLNASGAVNAALVVATFVALAVVVLQRFLPPTPSTIPLDTVRFSKNYLPAVFRPVSESGTALSDVQPGAALWVAGILAVFCLWRTPSIPGKLFTAASLFFVFLLVPFTPFAEAFWKAVPISLIAATSGAVNLRLTPVWVATLVFSGFGAIVWLQSRHRWWGAAVVLVFAAGVFWSAREALKIQRFSFSLVQSGPQTENTMRPENAALSIYSGNFIGLPDYFSHGVRDYRMESRIVDSQTDEPRSDRVVGMSEPVLREKVALRAVTSQTIPGWLELSPGLQLAPDDWLQLTFSFSRPDWTGILVVEGPYFYREYMLPSSGGGKAFGSAEGNSREIFLWSTAPAAQELRLRFRPDRPLPEPDDGTGWRFAEVSIRRLAEQNLPVRTLSLAPRYHAQATVSAAAVLETPRTWVPGYRARRNGQTVPVSPTAQRLVGVPLVPGVNDVELEFVGSRRLQVSFFVSLTAWSLLLFAAVLRYRKAN
jgi:hypothetical protein